MVAKLVNEMGSINIEESVIAGIAGIAAMECYGLVGMASRGAKDGIVELLVRENLSRGVKISTRDDSVVIDLYVIIQFGISISTVATNIIDKVKYAVEDATGLKVEKINVNVQGVRVQK